MNYLGFSFAKRLSLHLLFMQSIVQGFLKRPRQTTRGFRLFSSTSPSGLSSESIREPYSLRLSIPEPEICEDIGALISAFSEPPDVLFLDGDLGAGKTTFSRGFVKCKLGIDDNATNSIRVTSPTYLLSNTYEYKSGNSINEIRHMDLYRLSGDRQNDFSPLDLDFVFSKCISLVEWPCRLPIEIGPPLENRLDVILSIVPATDERQMTLRAPEGSTWRDRLRALVREGFVDDLMLENSDEISDV